MDRIEQLRIFARVVDCQSFTKAADTLGIPRSTVSTAVKTLEERVGTRLLNRTTRTVSPTNDGTAFYERCMALVSDVEEIENLFRTSSARLSGKLRVNVPGRIGRLIIAPALPEFFARFPEIALEVGITDRTVDLRHEGIDCVIRVGELADSTLIARRIGDVAIISCASKAYLAANGVPRRTSDLKRHRAINYVSPVSGKAEPWEYDSIDGSHTVAMRQAVAVDNAEMMIACCLAGLGLIQIPAYDVRAHIESGELVEVLPRHRAAPMPMHILYPHRRHLSARLQTFIDWVTPILRAKVTS